MSEQIINHDDTTIVADSSQVGSFPIRQDITVLPADDPKKLELGWKIYEGHECYKVKTQGLTWEQIHIREHWPKNEFGEYEFHHSADRFEDGNEGSELLTFSHWAAREGKTDYDRFDYKPEEIYHYYKLGKVKSTYVYHDEINRVIYWSEYCYSTLIFKKDDRQCWVETNLVVCNPETVKMMNV